MVDVNNISPEDSKFSLAINYSFPSSFSALCNERLLIITSISTIQGYFSLSGNPLEEFRKFRPLKCALDILNIQYIMIQSNFSAARILCKIVNLSATQVYFPSWRSKCLKAAWTTLSASISDLILSLCINNRRQTQFSIPVFFYFLKK